MTNLKKQIMADLFRIDGAANGRLFFRQWFWNPGFRYITLFRVCQAVRKNKWLKFTVYPLALWWLLRVGRLYGIRLPLSCQIGLGMYIAHWGNIWVNPGVVIGRNCTLAHDVTLGRISRGATEGVPSLGDHVYLGPGCRVLGKVQIGHHAMIAANAVVLQDVPDAGVVMGVPARLFSKAGSGDYVTHTIGS